MKKLFAILMCVAMVFSMVACGSDTKDPTQPQEKPGTTDTQPSESTPGDTTPGDTEGTEPSDTDVDETTIRPNGELPEDVDDLTRAEMNHYIGKVMKAMIELDVETMQEYASENSAYIIKSVKEDDVYRVMWEKTIGQSYYLEDSHILVYKDPQFVFGSWLTDAYKNGETLKASIDEYTEEEIVALFNKYSVNTPYIATELDISDDFDIDIEDGKIVIECNEAFAATEWDELSDVGVPHPISRSGEELANLAFGVHNEVSLGLEHIKEDGFTIWEAYITGDLGSIVTALDNASGYDMNAEVTDTTNQLMELVYQHFYKDAERVAKIQNWMDERVMIVRGMSSVYVYNPAELESTYPYYTLTDAEKQQIQDVNIYIVDAVHSHQANTDNEFYPFYEVVAQMARFGAIEWIYEGGPA